MLDLTIGELNEAEAALSERLFETANYLKSTKPDEGHDPNCKTNKARNERDAEIRAGLRQRQHDVTGAQSKVQREIERVEAVKANQEADQAVPPGTPPPEETFRINPELFNVLSPAEVWRHSQNINWLRTQIKERWPELAHALDLAHEDEH